jgi:hypothetical protein
MATSTQQQQSQSSDARPVEHSCNCVCMLRTRVDVHVDNQHIAISATWALTTPVPWDATCERTTTAMHNWQFLNTSSTYQLSRGGIAPHRALVAHHNLGALFQSRSHDWCTDGLSGICAKN